MATKTLGERIAFARSLGGISARSVDGIVGVSYGYTLKLEKGHTDNVGAGTLARLAKLFGASIDWLATGEGPAPTESTIRRAVAKAGASGTAPTGEPR